MKYILDEEEYQIFIKSKENKNKLEGESLKLKLLLEEYHRTVCPFKGNERHNQCCDSCPIASLNVVGKHTREYIKICPNQEYSK